MGLRKVRVQDTTFDRTGDKIQDEQCIAVHKLPPNLNALRVWLRHHSQVCRSIESGKSGDEKSSDIPMDVNHGIDTGKQVGEEVSDD